MIEMSRGTATHADKLERWLGAEQVALVSNQMKDFYWPVPLHGVPGNVYCMPGGDFCGKIDGGEFGSALDRGFDVLGRLRRAEQARVRNTVNHPRFRKQHGAFASLSAVIAAATGGKAQGILFRKTGVAANAAGNANDLWSRAGFPGAGTVGAAAPGGTVHNNTTTGALPGYRNGATTDANHFVSGWATASVVNNSLLLYDRLFAVAKTMNSTATEAVTGVPTRYQNATDTNVQATAGNFISISNPTTVLAATAHNITATTAVWTYTNQAGTGSKNLNHNGTAIQTLAGVSACVVGGIDLAVGNWFIPLAVGDYGIKSLQQMQLSAAVATGTLGAFIGHPIAVFPCPVANLVCPVDGINTAFNLTSILDGACLAFLELPKPATTATNYSGEVRIVSE